MVVSGQLFPLFGYRITLGKKIRMISYIHNILPIPHHPNAPPHPPNPTCWGRGRGGGWGTWGWGVGWGIGGVGYEKNIVYISIHTHMLVPRLRWEKIGKSSDSISDSTVLKRKQKKRQIECQAGVQSMR